MEEVFQINWNDSKIAKNALKWFNNGELARHLVTNKKKIAKQILSFEHLEQLQTKKKKNCFA